MKEGYTPLTDKQWEEGFEKQDLIDKKAEIMRGMPEALEHLEPRDMKRILVFIRRIKAGIPQDFNAPID
ncbi:MAG: hypothetical protein EXS47_02230 [Candidatus Zambryskibacteria bacterium]|nr:hypothetical protein [Candidatus Zambryskibacteria bacterium]